MSAIPNRMPSRFYRLRFLAFMSTVPNKVIYSMIGVSKFYDKKLYSKISTFPTSMARRSASSA